jgi:hypothetical protein
MELVLSVAALASFVALVGAWVAVPHSGQDQRAGHPTPEPTTAQVLGLN